jgi:hypothetical protein
VSDEPSWVVCVRTSDSPNPTSPGAQVRFCCDCGTGLWVSPSSLSIEPTPTPICDPCARAQARRTTGWKVLDPTDAQRAGLYAHGFTDAEIAATRDRMTRILSSGLN